MQDDIYDACSLRATETRFVNTKNVIDWHTSCVVHVWDYVGGFFFFEAVRL